MRLDWFVDNLNSGAAQRDELFDLTNLCCSLWHKENILLSIVSVYSTSSLIRHGFTLNVSDEVCYPLKLERLTNAWVAEKRRHGGVETGSRLMEEFNNILFEVTRVDR